MDLVRLCLPLRGAPGLVRLRQRAQALDELLLLGAGLCVEGVKLLVMGIPALEELMLGAIELLPEAVVLFVASRACLLPRIHQEVEALGRGLPLARIAELVGFLGELLLCGMRCFPLMGALCIDRVAGGLEGFPELVLLGGMPVVDGAPGVHRRPQLLRAVAPVGCAYEFLELADERFLLCDVSLA